MRQPRVSVVVPVRNRAPLLTRSIGSLLDQTYRNIELIVVDDASTDSTQKVVQGFRSARLQYIRLTSHRGVSCARNVGIRHSAGEYIAFQDSDDEWLPEKLEKQVQVMESVGPEIGVVYSGFMLIDGAATRYIPSEEIAPKEPRILRPLLRGNFVTPQTALVRRQCFTCCGMFDEALPCLVDWELWIRVASVYGFKYIDEPLANVYRSPDSISNHIYNKHYAIASILGKHDGLYAQHPRAHSLVLRSCGSLSLLHLGDRRSGLDYLYRSFVAHSSVESFMAMVAALLGRESYLLARTVWNTTVKWKKTVGRKREGWAIRW